MKRIDLFVLAIIFLCFSCESESTDDENVNNENANLELVNAFPNLSFNQPLDLQSPNDGTNRVFVVEKGGLIKAFSNNQTTDTFTEFLDVSGTLSTESEQGLLGLAFHPDFSSNGYFYVHYSPNTSTSRISRFTASNGNGADLGSELVLMDIPQPQTNHNGGAMAFGADGFLYMAIGDGGGAGDPNNNAQNRANLLGNILRIDVDNLTSSFNYDIPQDNPFVTESNVRPEIFAYGLRNPWRMSFDSQTGDLWVGDVGQGEIEEIDIIASGGNYGWRFFEGTNCFSGDCNDSGLTAPIFEYNHDNGDRSITGGYVYRGSEVVRLAGKYVYGDFVSGRIWAVDLDGSNNQELLDTDLNIAAFGTDANQELFICAFDGSIYKLNPVAE